MAKASTNVTAPVIDIGADPAFPTENVPGMTYRQYVAAQIIPALARTNTTEVAADLAVQFADSLIKRLSR